MLYKDGSNECKVPFEINLFLDVVLRTVLRHSQKRKVVFSSFNPDVCTMYEFRSTLQFMTAIHNIIFGRIRLKQNRYPVLLLTQGVNSKYDNYMDPRTWTIANGSNYASMSDILGLNAMAEDIQRDTSQVQMVKERGQVIFVWTDDQNDSSTVQYLKELGVDGIVYDR
jgi:glycerophosphocholine phosphodiesterase GPCPD1